MDPLATLMLCAVRYAHARSLHPYEDVITGIQRAWPLLDAKSQRTWLALVRSQVPADLERMIDAFSGSYAPVARDEIERERAAYLRLFAWCDAHLHPLDTETMPPLDYHLSSDVLRPLAALTNARATEDRYTFDLTRPLRLIYDGGAYWSLWGVAITGDVMRHQWTQGRTDGREDLAADLERCLRIEWTTDPHIALDRLLTVEQRRAARETTP